MEAGGGDPGDKAVRTRGTRRWGPRGQGGGDPGAGGGDTGAGSGDPGAGGGDQEAGVGDPGAGGGDPGDKAVGTQGQVVGTRGQAVGRGKISPRQTNTRRPIRSPHSRFSVTPLSSSLSFVFPPFFFLVFLSLFLPGHCKKLSSITLDNRMNEQRTESSNRKAHHPQRSVCGGSCHSAL